MLLSNSLDKLSKVHYDLERELLELFVNKTEIDLGAFTKTLEKLQNLHKIPGKIDLSKLHPEEELLAVLKNFQRLLTDICNQKIPIINIKSLSETCNNLAQHLSQDVQDYPLDHLEDGVAIISSKDEEIPITFSNGKQTVITSNNFNLSQFTREELIELLRLLDVIITDSKYDYLRTEIVDQLNSISNVTVINV